MKSAIGKSMTGGLVLLLVVVAVAMVPTRASAQEQLFMLVPGIPGGSQVSGRTGWIDIFSFSGGAVAPGTSSSTKSTPCQLAVQKQIDIAGPRLWVATVTGQIFNHVDIQVTTTTGTGSFLVYDILLTNVQFTSVSDGGAAGGGLPSESVSLKAASVSLTFTPQNADGSAGTPVTTSFSCN